MEFSPEQIDEIKWSVGAVALGAVVGTAIAYFSDSITFTTDSTSHSEKIPYVEPGDDQTYKELYGTSK